MKKILLFLLIQTSLYSNVFSNDDSLKFIQLKESIIELKTKDSLKFVELNEFLLKLEENYINEYNESSTKVIDAYSLTNERINNQLTFIGIIATIFGVIIGLGTIYIGFESIKASQKRKSTLRTIEEAKTFVEDKKEKFDELLKGKYEEFNKEYTKLLKLAREQLIENLNTESDKMKELASKKSKELEDISIRQKPDKIIENISKKLEFFENVGIPDDPEVLLSKAKLLSDKEMYIESNQLLHKLVEIKPDNDDAYWRLGWNYAALKNNEEAISNYKKAIELNDKESSTYNNLGVQYVRTEKYMEALKEYDKAIELSPNEALYYKNKGEVLVDLKSYDDALKSFHKALELKPNEISYYEKAISSLKEINRFEDVIEFYDLAIKNIPEKSSETNFNKAGYLMSNKKYDEARQLYQLLIENNYKPEDCRKFLSYISYFENKYEDAIVEIEEAISLNPKKEELHRLKVLYLIKKDKEEAKISANKILESFKDEKFYFQIARMFSKVKEMTYAKEIYNKALELIKLKLDDKKPQDRANYIESLIITENYEEVDKFYEENKEIIEKSEYDKLIEFLLIIKTVLVTKKLLSEFNLSNLKDYYAIENNKANWNFEDILYMIEERIEKDSFDLVKEFCQFIKGEKSLDELNSI